MKAFTFTRWTPSGANVYLHRLARLGRFVDLGGVTLEGEASAKLDGRREPDGAFGAGTVELTDFAFTDRTGKGLKEPELKLQVHAIGKAPAGGPVELATATVTLTANGDELRVTLLEPVADVRNLASGASSLRVSGDLARWKARAAGGRRGPAVRDERDRSPSGKAKFAGDRITVDRLTVGLTNAKFRGAGIIIDEPTMNAVGDFPLTRATSIATVAKLTLTSAPLSVTNGTLTFELPKDGDRNRERRRAVRRAISTGSGRRWNSTPTPAGRTRCTAAGPGRSGFRYAGDVTTFGGTLDVTGFAYGPKDKPVWANRRCGSKPTATTPTRPTR